LEAEHALPYVAVVAWVVSILVSCFDSVRLKQ